MMVFFTQKKAMVFVASQVIFHDAGQEVDDLMNLSFAHAGHKHAGKPIIAETVEKFNERLLVGGAIHPKKHRLSVWCKWTLAGDDFPPHLAVARAVEFAEKNALPGSEPQASLMDEHRGRRACQRAHQVGRRVALGMAIRVAGRRDLVEGAKQVPLHIRVGAFVYQQSGGGVGIVKIQNPLLDGAGCNDLLQPGRQIDHLQALNAGDRKLANMGRCSVQIDYCCNCQEPDSSRQAVL